MSTRKTEIIAATTGMAMSSAFQPVGSVTVTAGILATGEGVLIQYTNDGTEWQDLYFNGVLQQLDENHSMITLLGPGKFRCFKSITAGSVSVNIWESEANL